MRSWISGVGIVTFTRLPFPVHLLGDSEILHQRDVRRADVGTGAAGDAILEAQINRAGEIGGADVRGHLQWQQAHWAGTDQLGRDLLSRIIYGARTALGTSGALGRALADPGSAARGRLNFSNRRNVTRLVTSGCFAICK